MKGLKTEKLVTVGLLLALEVILSTLFTFNLAGIAKFGFGFLPIAMIAILYGPLWAGITYAIGDVLAWFIKPEGAYFPGMTLTCFLIGLLFGILLYKKEITFARCLIMACIVVITMDLLLNTFWLHILMNQGYIALLPSRIAKCAIQLASETLLIPVVWNKVMLRIPSIAEQIPETSRVD